MSNRHRIPRDEWDDIDRDISLAELLVIIFFVGLIALCAILALRGIGVGP